MSVNGITGIPGVSSAARVAAAASEEASARASANATANTAAASASAKATTITATADEVDAKPVTVHFPWLSRLSAELEAASNKRAPFSNQIMGDNLNQKA